MDSSGILNAVIAKLGADTTLLGLMPNGVYEDEAPPGSKRFVIVSQIVAVDVDVFGQRAIEDMRFFAEARALIAPGVPLGNVAAAAARIDELLDPQPPADPATIDVAGYGCMRILREEFLRPPTEVDERDATIRWRRRGGQYRVWMSVQLG
jgi:hypothetical protein